LNKKEDDVK